VVLVDKHNYHTFSPMLYQVATDLVAPATIGHPLRDLFHEQPNVEVHEASVSKIDPAAKRVSFAEMDRSPTTTLCWPSPWSSSTARFTSTLVFRRDDPASRITVRRACPS
jgi:NADH dehydrogenase FAD-containing subunit